MTESLMFEVGIKRATDEYEKIKQEIDDLVKTGKSPIEIKVRIEDETKSLQNFLDILNKIGQGSQIKDLKEQVDNLLSSFNKAGIASSSIDMSALKTQLDKIDQTSTAITKKVEELKRKGDSETSIEKSTEGLRRQLNGQLNTLKSKFNLTEDAARQIVNSSKEIDTATKTVVTSITGEGSAAQGAVQKLNALVAEKQQVVEAEKKLADTSQQSAKSLQQEGDQASKVSKQIENVSKAEKASENAIKSQGNNIDTLLPKYNILIQRIENWQSVLSKALANGGHSNYFDAQIKSAINEYQNLKEEIEKGKSTPSADNLSQLRTALTLLGQEFANVNKEASAFNKEQEKVANSAQKAIESANRKITAAYDQAAKSINGPLQDALTRGENAGRNMAALEVAMDRLDKHTIGLSRMSDAEKQNTELVNSRVRSLRLEREEVERLAKTENKLTTAYEQAQKKGDREAAKKIQEEAKSVNDAYIKYNKLGIKLEELKALRERGLKMKMDVSDVQLYIGLLNQVRTLLSEIVSNNGRTISSQTLSNIGLKEGMLTSDVMKANAIKSAMNWDESYLNQFVKKLVETERNSSRAEGSIRKLGIAFNNLKDYISKNGGSQEMRNLQSEIQGAIQKMRQLMNAGDYAGAMRVFEKMSGSLRQVTTATKEYEGAKTSATAAEMRFANAIKSSSDNMKNQSQILSDLKTMAMQYISVWGAQSFVNSIIQTGGLLEQQRLSLSAILGDMSKANDLFGKVKDLAIKSPFGVVQIDQMTKQLAAYGFQYNELFDWTKRLGDISAATGTSVDRLALALGHVRSEGALSGYTLRQFAMANVPLLKMLAESRGVTTKEIRDLVRKKEISDKEVQDILLQLTSQGGMFYNAQEVMSEALNAKFKNLKDSFDIMFGEIAEGKIGKALKLLAQGLTEASRRWQAFGTVIGIAGAGLVAYKLGLLALNTGLRVNAANLLKSSVNLSKLTATEIEDLAIKKMITREELVQAVATKKLTFEQAKLAAAYMHVDVQMLKNVGSANKYKLAMQGLASTGFMKMLTSPWTAVLLVIEAVIGTLMEYKSWSDKVAENINSEIDIRRNAQKDIGKFLGGVEGKPTDEKELSAQIDQMETILKNANLYTDELKTQVGLAPSLSAEYDVLIKKMNDANSTLMKMGANAETLIDTVKASSSKIDWKGWIKDLLLGGIPGVAPAGILLGQLGIMDNSYSKAFDFMFNDDINKNVDDLAKTMGAFQRQMSVLDEYSGSMSKAIDSMIAAGSNLDLANKPLEEQIRILAEDGDAWDEFVAKAGDGSEYFRDRMDVLRDAAEGVTGDWEEIVDDDIPRMMKTLAEHYNMDEEEFKKYAKAHPIEFGNMLDVMLAKANEKAPEIGAAIRRGIFNWVNDIVGAGQNSLKQKDSFVTRLVSQQQKRIADMLSKVKGYGREGSTAMKLIRDYADENGKDKNVITIDFVSKYFESGKGYKEAFDKIGKDYKELTAKLEAAKKAKDNVEIARIEKALAPVKLAKEALDIDIKGEKSGKNSSEDENAKAIRERVRIIKEAANAYLYWLEKVGKEGAWGHVKEEFGDVLEDIEVTADNIEDLKGNLQKTLDLDKYALIKDLKVKREIQKEIAKEQDQIKRKDFEKSSDEFASKVKIAIDSLTRSWEIFNNVREATGDIELAVKLSGADYNNGQNRNLADSLREKIERDFYEAGAVGINFDINLSDEEIEERIKLWRPQDKQSADEYEKMIKGLVDEYKKWRDLQRDVIKNDVASFTKMMTDADSMRQKLILINDQYKQQIKSLENLQRLGVISPETALKREKTEKQNRDVFMLQTLVDGIDWGKSFDGFGRVFENEVRAVYSQVMGYIKSDKFLGLDSATQKRIIEIADKLRQGGGAGSSGMFNAKSWKNLADSQERLRDSLDALFASTLKLRNAQDEVTRLEEIISSPNATNEEKNAAKLLLEKATTAVTEAATEVQSNVSKVKQNQSDVDDQGEKAAEGLREFNQILGEMTSSKLGDFSLGIINLVRSIGGKDLFNSLSDALSNGGIYGQIIAAVLSILDAIGDDAAGFIDDLFDKISRAVENLLKDLPQVVGSIFEGIGKLVGGVVNSRGSWFGVDFGIGGADYSSYNKAKKEYEDLIKIWDDLISRKRAYLNESWGTEAANAAKEAIKLIQMEIEETKELAKMRLEAGASTGSHRIEYRMWQGSYRYEGKNWNAVAGEISRALGGVKFTQMSDMLNMTSEQLLWIKQNYSGLWAHMDEEFRNHLENLIKYGDDIQDTLDEVDAKLHGLSFDELVDSYYQFVTSAKDANEELSDDLESKLKEAIVKGMIENLYGERIQELMNIATEYGKNDTYIDRNGNIRTHKRDSNGNILDTDVASEYTKDEYDAIMGMAKDINDDKNNTYDILKALYGWTDDDESTSTGKSIQGVTEQTADLLASYLNAIRADVSVNRAMIGEYFPMFYNALTSGNSNLQNIENHTAAIMRSNDAIASSVADLQSDIRGLKNKTWSIPIA